MASAVVRRFWRYTDLQDIIAILGIDELSGRGQDGRAALARSQRFLSQPFFVAEVFTGAKGDYVPRAEAVRGFQENRRVKHDALPESAFYMQGTIDQDVEACHAMAPSFSEADAEARRPRRGVRALHITIGIDHANT